MIPITAEVTAYCPHCAACGTTGRTADGTDTKRAPYNLAADPSLPFGAMVWIPAGHGLLDNVRAFDRAFRVDDRGGAVTREAGERDVLRLDLRVISHREAQRIGRVRLTVFLIKEEL
jgi:3D (Asp-Asp-Asp) domain-containing protein